MRSYISFPSKLHKKIHQTNHRIHRNQMENSASKRRWYFAHQSHAEQSTSKRRQFFTHRNYIEESMSKWRRNLPIFSFRCIDIILTSNRCRFDAMYPLRSHLKVYYDGSQIWVSQTQGISREKWLTKISLLDSNKFNEEFLCSSIWVEQCEYGRQQQLAIMSLFNFFYQENIL